MIEHGADKEIELEYTFLAAALPLEIEGLEPQRLVDVYIPEGTGEHPHLRVRQKGSKYEITKKSPVVDGDSSVMHETTIPLDATEFSYLSKSSPLRVVKDRYQVTIGGFAAEVDVFRESLEGLVLIDFEFSSLEERALFVVPEICLVDVTQEDIIAGGLLAGKVYADIAGRLKELGYEPIV